MLMMVATQTNRNLTMMGHRPREKGTSTDQAQENPPIPQPVSKR